MKRNNHQKGKYSKRKGQQEELHIAKLLTKWSRKSYGKTSTFLRTYSSGANAKEAVTPGDYLLSDVYASGKVAKYWCFAIEAKYYNSTTLRRYYEGTKRLQSWLLEEFHDSAKHPHHITPLLITKIKRFRDMVLLPYQKDFFKQMSEADKPCWVSFAHFTVPRTGRTYKFLMILTDLQSIIKAITCKAFIHDYENCNWNRFNKKYSKYHTRSYMQKHTRAELSKATNPVLQTFHKVKKS